MQPHQRFISYSHHCSIYIKSDILNNKKQPIVSSTEKIADGKSGWEQTRHHDVKSCNNPYNRRVAPRATDMPSLSSKLGDIYLPEKQRIKKHISALRRIPFNGVEPTFILRSPPATLRYLPVWATALSVPLATFW